MNGAPEMMGGERCWVEIGAAIERVIPHAQGRAHRAHRGTPHVAVRPRRLRLPLDDVASSGLMACASDVREDSCSTGSATINTPSL